jgi:hypothetical protein
MKSTCPLGPMPDNDEGKGKLETFLSSSTSRKFGDPSTFHAVTLARPLRFGAWPELFERVLSFSLVKMDAQGRFTQDGELEGTYSQGEGITWEATPDLSRIEAFVQWFDDAPRQLTIRYTWNPKTGSYDEERFERPSVEE